MASLFFFRIAEDNDLEYKPIKVRGKFDHTQELYMTPRSLMTGSDHGLGLISIGGGNLGSLVITPFIVSDTK